MRTRACRGSWTGTSRRRSGSCSSGRIRTIPTCGAAGSPGRWARPAVPLWRVGALRAWEWIEQEWVIVVNGVYYYGDGYYYDGYNYYYNGEYHTVPPPPMYFQ